MDMTSSIQHDVILRGISQALCNILVYLLNNILDNCKLNHDISSKYNF